MPNEFPAKEFLDALFQLTESHRLKWSQVQDGNTAILGGLSASTTNHTVMMQHHGIAPGNITLIVADSRKNTAVYAVHGMHISPQERVALSELWRTALESQANPSELKAFRRDLQDIMEIPPSDPVN